MTLYKPQKIFINKDVQDAVLTKRLLERCPEVPHTVIENEEQLKQYYQHAKDPLTAGKQYLYVTKNKGRFLKKCPGTQGFVCCNYYVIDLIENCHFECRYCFLQGYLNNPMITIYVNVEQLIHELDELITDKNKLYRIGTGELSDSLALDTLTGFSEILVSYFSTKENALLELKTKSNQVEGLLRLKSKGRTVVSWSVNPPEFIARNEEHTATLTQRLDSARACMNAGYQIGLHFDPIIHYPGWEAAYKSLIDRIFDTIDSQSIAWISMGTLRYTNQLKEVIHQRFPESSILNEEFLESPDGKYRYFVPLRQELYTKLRLMCLAKDPKLMIYLCMEAKHMWKRVYSLEGGQSIQFDSAFKNRQKIVQSSMKQIQETITKPA